LLKLLQETLAEVLDGDIKRFICFVLIDTLERVFIWGIMKG